MHGHNVQLKHAVPTNDIMPESVSGSQIITALTRKRRTLDESGIYFDV